MFLESSGRLRAGWRLGIFASLLLLLALGIQEALTGVLGTPEDEAALWAGVAVLMPAAVLASWIVAETLEKLPLAALGLPWTRPALRSFAAGAALGLFLIGGVLLVLVAAGWLRWAPAAGTPLEYAAAAGRLGFLLAAAAFTEELLFRGYPLQVVAEGAGFPVAIALTSVAFGLLHTGNPGAEPLSVLNITLAGGILGLAYWRTYSLWYVTGVHFGWNWSMGLADLSVSGLPMRMPAIDPALRGPEVWTGGAFGPEGGLVVTAMTVLGSLWVWRTRRLSRSLEILALRPLPERRGGPDRPPPDETKRNRRWA